jgi:seryl-tRNA(Sec) selenium transferase
MMTDNVTSPDEAPFDPETARLFAEAGTRPVINAAGAYTMLGGSTLSPGVRSAMEAANHSFVDMKTLFEGSGRARRHAGSRGRLHHQVVPRRWLFIAACRTATTATTRTPAGHRGIPSATRRARARNTTTA